MSKHDECDRCGYETNLESSPNYGLEKTEWLCRFCIVLGLQKTDLARMGNVILDEVRKMLKEPTYCHGCVNEVDFDTCHCGVDKENHAHEEHTFVPMGCDCYREKSE